jgi:hypothetical protein
MTKQDALRLLKLSIQAAMVGEVTQGLYAVTCGIDEKTIRIRSYYTVPLIEDELEPMRCVGTEVLADFPEDYTINEEFLPCNFDIQPGVLDFWAFKRKRTNDFDMTHSVT